MSADAVVIGSGHNALVAAVRLAREGWSVVVLEANDTVGGCVRSGEATVPGVVHDLYSTNHNLFRQSAAYAAWQGDLERHGLRFAHSDNPFCNVFPDGTALRVYADADRTEAELRAHSPADADGFRRLQARFEDFSKLFLPLYQTPLPSAAAAAALARGTAAVGVGGAEETAQIALASTRELGDSYFETPEAKALLATWGMHMDYGPDVSGGSVFPLLETFSNINEGMVVAEGGASRLPEALVGMLEEAGGEVRTGTRATRVVVEGGRAVGVEVEPSGRRSQGGETVRAGRAVLAGLTPHVLYDRLLAGADLPEAFRRKVERYQHGPATMMLHLALDGPAPWAAGPDVAAFAYVHLPPTVEDLARTYRQSRDGLLPDSPLLIVGQTTAVDPTRAPAGTHVLWVQVRTLPPEIRGDAAGEIDATDWDEAIGPFTERVLDKLERFAPGLRERVVGQAVMSPADLEASNACLVGGDSLGGSLHLRQNFLFRPFPGWSRYETPVRDLWACGASTWPGPGNNGGSGWLAAGRMLAPGLGAKAALGAAAVGAGGAALWAALRGGDD